jgi:cell division protein FtsX
MTHPKNTTRTISEETQIELMAQSIRNIESGVKEIKTTLKQDYATREELDQLKEKLGYVSKAGMFIIALIATALIAALMNTVLRVQQ